jgi:hypothetical protein
VKVERNSRRLSTTKRRRDHSETESPPVMVPRNDKPLVAVRPQRARRLREHLLNLIREMRDQKRWASSASTALREPTGFPAKVAQTACALCKGWCCRNGDDDGFLDGQTLVRVRAAKPDVTDGELLRLYLGRVPAVAFRPAYSTGGKAARWIDRSAPTFATAITVAASAPI